MRLFINHNALAGRMIEIEHELLSCGGLFVAFQRGILVFVDQIHNRGRFFDIFFLCACALGGGLHGRRIFDRLFRCLLLFIFFRKINFNRRIREKFVLIGNFSFELRDDMLRIGIGGPIFFFRCYGK